MIQVPTPSFGVSSIFYLHILIFTFLLLRFSFFLSFFSSFRFPPSLCFVSLMRNKEVSAWNFSIFWAIFMSFFFLLDNFQPPFTWFFRRTCTGLCVHFLYISSILGELVLVFLWESEKYILAEFWFQPVLTETVTWERERTDHHSKTGSTTLVFSSQVESAGLHYLLIFKPFSVFCHNRIGLKVAGLIFKTIRTRQYLRSSIICLHSQSCKNFTIIREK